jgi:hypothetical protein
MDSPDFQMIEEKSHDLCACFGSGDDQFPGYRI